MDNYDAIDGDFFEGLNNNDTIVYSKTDFVWDAFRTPVHHKVLITHNSDINITEDLWTTFANCGKYDYWFAQNVACKHDRLIPIPIGLERKFLCNFVKYDILRKCRSEYHGTPSHTLYANFSIGTQPDKRSQCIRSFWNKGYITNKVWMYTPGVHQLTVQQYADYCNDILDHKFVLCPEGHGIDTHRLWETLYLGRIPVVLHNHVNDAFQDLPIMILDKWSDFETECEKITSITDFDMSKITREYWINRINNI